MQRCWPDVFLRHAEKKSCVAKKLWKDALTTHIAKMCWKAVWQKGTVKPSYKEVLNWTCYSKDTYGIIGLQRLACIRVRGLYQILIYCKLQPGNTKDLAQNFWLSLPTPRKCVHDFVPPLILAVFGDDSSVGARQSLRFLLGFFCFITNPKPNPAMPCSTSDVVAWTLASATGKPPGATFLGSISWNLAGHWWEPSGAHRGAPVPSSIQLFPRNSVAKMEWVPRRPLGRAFSSKILGINEGEVMKTTRPQITSGGTRRSNIARNMVQKRARCGNIAPT